MNRKWQQKYEQSMALARMFNAQCEMTPQERLTQRVIGIWLSENCSKPANTFNSVSFGELMHQLGAEAESKNTNGVSFGELMRELRGESS